jgi:hypothetical protein
MEAEILSTQFIDKTVDQRVVDRRDGRADDGGQFGTTQACRCARNPNKWQLTTSVRL